MLKARWEKGRTIIRKEKEEEEEGETLVKCAGGSSRIATANSNVAG